MPSKSFSSWSRTGCATCKRRHKKCDQGQPTCRNCTKRGIQCDGYQQMFVPQAIRHRKDEKSQTRSRLRDNRLSANITGATDPETLANVELSPSTRFIEASAVTWEDVCSDMFPEHLSVASSDLNKSSPDEDDVISLDRCPGASPRPESTTSFISDPSLPQQTFNATIFGPVDFLDNASETADIVRNQSEMLPPNVEPHSLISKDCLGSPQAISAFPHISGLDFQHLQYLYEQGATQLLNMDAGPSNPLRRLLLPRAFGSTGLLNAMCAVAACHRAQRSDADKRLELSVTAAGFYTKAVNWLRKSFDPGRRCSGLANVDDASLFTTVLLCKYEIIQGSMSNWKGHLDGLSHLLQIRGGVDSLDHGSAQYITSFVRYHRLVSDICNISTGKEINSSPEAPSSSILDVYSGCAHYLLRGCHAISNLARRLESKEVSEIDTFLTHTGLIVDSLGTSYIELNMPTWPKGITVSQISRLIFVAHRIRHAAFVFLHSVIDRARTVLSFSESQLQDLESRIPYTKAQALDGCLDMLGQIPLGEHCEFAALTLPLFLAGCETHDSERKFLILESLFVMETSFGIGNIARAKDALMKIWQQQRGPTRKVWWVILQEIGWELILS